MAGKKIAVLGTGANGAGIGADLTRAGLDVTFIEQWPENVQAIRENGVRVEMPDETTVTPVRAIHLCEVATLREKFDIVLVLVKAYDTRWACELIKPVVHDDGLVVGLQNGMTLDTVADVLGAHRALGAVIEVTASMFVPGVVERHTPPAGSWFGVGSFHSSTQGRENEITEVLQHAGTADVADDIRSAKWMKLIANSGEVLPSAIVDLPLLDAVHLPGMRDFMFETCRESARVATALGNRLVPIFGLPAPTSDDPDLYATTLLNAVFNDYSLPHTQVALLQDWRKGRRGEVDDMNGIVVEAQDAAGVKAPHNSWTVEIAHRIERGELERGPHNLELLLSLGA